MVSLVFSRLDLNLLHHVRRFVAAFIKAHSRKASADTVSKAMLAAHELLENSSKYGTDGEASLEVHMHIGSGNSLTLRTLNRATPANAAVVDGPLKRLKKTAPQRLYQKLLHETSRPVPRPSATEFGFSRMRRFDGRRAA